jgi:pimeloyl-ACP methyl ester carboxylesterase
VDYWRVLAGEERPFDEAAFRALASRDVGGASDFRAEIPDARLLRLEGAGHAVYRADWEAIVTEILEQT